MKNKIYLLGWTIILPVMAWVVYLFHNVFTGHFYSLVLVFFLISSVLAAVYHSEIIAYRVGEPYGTLLLAFAITVIEAALIISIMLSSKGLESISLARDTVFAAVMIILTGIIGVCIIVGSLKYREQVFTLQGVSTALITLTSIVVFILILPNYTISHTGGEYTPYQLIFISLICLALYIGFTMIQTVRHRAYFIAPIPNKNSDFSEDDIPLEKPSRKVMYFSIILLLLCLGIVVLLAKNLSKDVDTLVIGLGAPKSLVGIIIAGIVLLPEGLAAIRAAYNNRLQTSLNLALGSALASIGLSIPFIAFVSVIADMRMMLGISIKSILLLGLSLFIITVSLATGRTNIMQGLVLIAIFILYLFTTLEP
ncbi:ionic transporter y4hA [Elizabethkingia sp. HX WHF]|uniref:calcium:proton antiporter n=1 Tax=Elizabethkingia TaxID=308865 RepID=UPI00099AFFBF|nr:MULTISPECIES: ionic transporter y4hA [Elizabethkingia]ATL43453.1 ionic transporter y4hA [Elizabethkingia miricola]MCL1638461.1 ionic transporter y4hA [Elizabethkingia bruuniana]MDX8564510.1 ionic transporter y4hA [Elizabethkingia sp. HX WHF]OPC26297.1 ionic transporter y4hA [Elizabethkingia bruuniana]